MIQPIDLENFLQFNPWRENKPLNFPDFIYRTVYPNIKKWLDSPDIIILQGARQVGKTSLLQHLISDLLKDGIDPQDIFYFNLDNESLLKFFSHPGDLIRFIKSQQKQKSYIFCDEMQKVQNPGNFLKYIYDLKDPSLKLLVSGSSSLEIKAKIFESLTGRKKTFIIYPLTFEEFLRIKSTTLAQILVKLKQEPDQNEYALYRESLLKYFSEFILFGAYPKIVMEPDLSKKIKELEDIYESYIEKDVKKFFNIEKTSAYSRLLSLLAGNIGCLLNLHQLSNTLNLHFNTLEKYLHILEQTYILSLVRPYFSNIKKEITKMPKVYFIDLGLRNFILRGFGNLENRADTGQLVENITFLELHKYLSVPNKINFWRTYKGAEVDFVLSKGIELIPYEVKWQKQAKPKLSVSFKNFIKTYNPKQAFILGKENISQMKMNDSQIYFKPVFLV